ncbi:MAG: PAC2 family protein [Chloroflexi bacterium]|nr:PAC2 family protein [Chloroflexota bacterium]
MPKLREPHALVVLSPWIDAGSVGTLVMSALSARFGARELGRLAKPGCFFDFTRYRPVTLIRNGMRELSIPNSVISYSINERGNDFLFIRLLEPHMWAENYVESTVKLLQRMSVKRYCLIGAMYDVVPHTRALLVSGSARGKGTERDLQLIDAQRSDYQGPTTITMMISEHLHALGAETMSLIVHLPQYAQADEDFSGYLRMLEMLSIIYRFPIDSTDIEKARKHMARVNTEVSQDPQLEGMVKHMEKMYDARSAEHATGVPPKLAPEVERFLSEMDKRFRTN